MQSIISDLEMYGRGGGPGESMIKSMTAFARAERQDGGELVWELRSVNHRYLEIQPRLPEAFRVLEPQIRERVAARVGRGKVECALRYQPDEAMSGELRVSETLLAQLEQALETVRHQFPRSPEPGLLALLAWPGVVAQESPDLTPVQTAALSLLDQVLEQLVTMREQEGARLAQLVAERLDQLEDLVEKARRRMPEVIAAVRQRLQNRLEEVSRTLDAERLEMEMALLAQRLDVDEEMDRLQAHIAAVRQALAQDEPVGRRLDFLMQELNREANTLGSKSADAETTALAVEMKVLIEQMREQVQNIE